MRHEIGTIRARGFAPLAKKFGFLPAVPQTGYGADVWPSRTEIDDTGHWKESGIIGAGVVRHWFKPEYVDSLPDLVPLLRRLENERDRSIVIGRARREAVKGVDGDWVEIEGRRIANYEDVPTHLLIVDIDSLDGDLSDAPDILRDALYDIPELDGCAHVGSFTGSAGIKAGLRVRAFIETKHALTARQQRDWVKRINAAHGNLFDASLYSLAHIVATAAPAMTIRYLDGPNVRVMDGIRPVPQPTIWYMDGDVADIGTTTAAQTVGMTPDQIALMDDLARSGPTPGEDPGTWFNSIAPGNIADNVHKLICSTAFRSADGTQDDSMMDLYRRVWRKVRLISDGDPVKWAERQREHLDLERWRRTWQEARKRKSKVVLTPAAPQPVQQVPAHLTPRQLLTSQVGAAADEIIDQHTALQALVTSAPGSGKSFAIREIITEARLANRCIRIVAPTHELCAQHAADLKAHALTLPLTSTFTNQQLADRIRHHKGRTQPGMCTNERFGALATRAERVGISAKKTVCSQCPDRGTCKWIAQFEDTDPGVIIEAQQAFVSKGRTKDDWAQLYIVDESLVSVVLGEQADPIDIDAIVPAKGNTALVEWRHELYAWLMAHMPTEKRKRGLLKPDPEHYGSISYSVGTESHTGTQIDRWLSIEELHRQRIAKAVLRSVKWQELAAEFELSANISRLLEAMALCEHRDRVYGARVYFFERGIGPQRRKSFRLAIQRRIELPEHLLTAGAIWLDGTAKLDSTFDIWKAMLAPDGAEFPWREINVQPEVGHVYGVQCVDGSYSKTALLNTQHPEDDTADTVEEIRRALDIKFKSLLDPDDLRALQDQAAQADMQWRVRAARTAAKADARLRRVWATTVDKALRHKQVVLMAQKDAIAALKAMGLPGNVRCAHFNALRGLNEFRNTPCAIVVGRPAAALEQLEMMTEALYVRHPDVQITLADKWTTAPGKIALTGNRDAQVLVERHPDARCAALQSLISHAEVVQAVARIRPFDRGPHNPCDLVVFGQYQTGVPMQHVGMATELTPRPVETCWTIGGLFLTPAHNETAFGGLADGTLHRHAQRAILAGARVHAYTALDGVQHYAVLRDGVTGDWIDVVLQGRVSGIHELQPGYRQGAVTAAMRAMVTAIAEDEPALRPLAERALDDDDELAAFLADWSPA